MKKRTTVADVARAANVSMMTVSRVMNDKPGVRKELRQQILELAEEMGYQPNKIARGLATNRMGTVGLVVPSISNPFYAQIAQGVEDAAYERGYNVFLVNTIADLAREEAALNSLWAQNIDGAIVCSLRLPQDRMVKSIERFPAAVLVNRVLERPLPNVATICVNDERAAREAVEHFIERGRRCIAYIGGPENAFSGQRRLAGYQAALKKAGIPCDPSFVMHIMPDTDTGRQAAETLFSRHPDIDAILTFNDLVAVGALQACQAAGRQVPGEVAIIGADDIPIASLIRPALSTSHVNLAQLGQLCMQTLLEIFAGQVTTAAYTIEPELVLRESG